MPTKIINNLEQAHKAFLEWYNKKLKEGRIFSADQKANLEKSFISGWKLSYIITYFYTFH